MYGQVTLISIAGKTCVDNFNKVATKWVPYFNLKDETFSYTILVLKLYFSKRI